MFYHMSHVMHLWFWRLPFNCDNCDYHFPAPTESSQRPWCMCNCNATALIWASKLSLPQPFSTWLCSPLLLHFQDRVTSTFTLPGQGHLYFYTSRTGSRVLLHFLDRVHCTFTLSYLTQHSDHTYFTNSKRVKERDAQCASHNQNLVTRYAQIATR